MTPIILIGLAILACALARAPKRIKPAWSQHLPGWQKIFGVVAFLLAVLMIINPELLALGLLGDTAFFDALVLLLSLQLHSVTVRAWCCVRAVFSKAMRFMLWRLSVSCSLLILAFAPVGEMVSAIQKAVHRFSS
jgi:hypothetical protein